MIHIFGDSHSHDSFNNLELPYIDNSHGGITMFRTGRDNIIIHFNKNNIKPNDIIIIGYGEVDCRCHIQKQINLGKDEDDIINEIVNNYFKTIKNNITDNSIKIIILGVIPPTKQSDYETKNGPILSEFPFVGTDESRVRYTTKVNKLLEDISNKNSYIYFNPYSEYTRPDGTLKYEMSDSTVHLKDNRYFLEKFMELYNKFH